MRQLACCVRCVLQLAYLSLLNYLFEAMWWSLGLFLRCAGTDSARFDQRNCLWAYFAMTQTLTYASEQYRITAKCSNNNACRHSFQARKKRFQSHGVLLCTWARHIPSNEASSIVWQHYIALKVGKRLIVKFTWYSFRTDMLESQHNESWTTCWYFDLGVTTHETKLEPPWEVYETRYLHPLLAK